MRFFSNDEGGVCRNKRFIRSATATDDVHESFVHEFTHLRGHRLGCLVVESHRVRQSGIGIGTDIIGCLTGQFLEERFHLGGTKRAVQSQREDVVGADTRQEGIERLATQRSSCKIAHGDGEHDRQSDTSARHHTVYGVDSHLRIQRVEDGLDEHGVYPTLYQSVSLLFVGF